MAAPTKAGTRTDKAGHNAYRAAFEQATQIASATETLARCAEIEAAVESLRVRYEQYFLGLTRRPPGEDHALVRSAVLRMRQGFVRNTSARFRVQSLHNRFLSYERLWQRTCREIEEGTYRRDVFKARMRRKDQESAEDARAAAELATFRSQLASNPLPDGDEDDFAVDEEEPVELGAPPAATPRSRAAASPPRAAVPPSAHGSALQDEKLRAVYDAYVGAKKRCSESTEGLSFDAVAASLRKQVPGLLAAHNATAVDFKVVIKGGKAVLKAIPR